jgi:hydrogenase maturation protease
MLRERLAPSLCAPVEFLDDYQLQIEHVLDLVGRKRVLFVDASLNCASPFEAHSVQPSRDTSSTRHGLSPEALLQVFLDSEGYLAPPSTLLAIRGEMFGLGEPMSASAQRNLELALAWGLEWISCAE